METFFVTKHAPIGKPPPIPLAIGTISGVIPEFSNAKKFPVLYADCTSSKIKSILCSSHNSLKPFIQKSGTTLIPPSPIIVSIIIAAVFLFIVFFIAS